MSLRDRVIVLDFDGVVWDSVDESFEQAQAAWTRLRGRIDLTHDDARSLFREARWQCKDGHDFFIVMSLLSEGRRDVGDMTPAAFRALRETMARGEAPEAFVSAFYESRARMRDERFEHWCALQRPFPGVVEQIDALRREARAVAVATTKDGPSAQALLERAGISGLAVYGREVSLDKRDHMRAIQQRFDVETKHMAFVEDLLENLHGVAPLGLRLVLADWGYNTPSQCRQARDEGVSVVSLHDFAERIRGLWD